jgi:hypothetical protein
MGQPDPQKNLYLTCRASKFDDENADPPIHSANEWLQQEMGEPLGFAMPLTSLTTTSAAFIVRFVLRPRWKRNHRSRLGTN